MLNEYTTNFEVQPIFLCVLCFFTTFFAARYCTIAIQISEFDDLGFLNIVVAMSLSAIFYWKAIGLFPESGIPDILVTIGSFYVGMNFMVQLIPSQKIRKSIRVQLLEATATDNAFYLCLFALFLFCTVAGIFAVLQLGAKTPDERMLFTSKFRPLDAMRTGATILFSYISFVRIMGLREKKTRWLFAPFLGLTIMSGAKGALVNFVQDLMIAQGALRGRRTPWKDFRFILLYGTIAVGFGVVVVTYYFGDILTSLKAIGLRIFLSGDIYMISYATADYHDLFEKFEPLPYLLHPFLKLIGLKGYDYPLGCALMELITGNTDFGPNAHLSILSLVFAKGNLWIAGMLCFFAGIIVVLFKCVAAYLLSEKRLPPAWRIGLFFGIFQSGLVFIDIGLYEQRLISLAIVLFILSGIFELIGGRYRRSPRMTIADSH